jgi:hypothetical protein
MSSLCRAKLLASTTSGLAWGLGPRTTASPDRVIKAWNIKPVKSFSILIFLQYNFLFQSGIIYVLNKPAGLLVPAYFLHCLVYADVL